MDLGTLSWNVDVDTRDLERAERDMEGVRDSATGARRSTERLGDGAERAGRRTKTATGEMQRGFGGVKSAIQVASAALAAFGIGRFVTQTFNAISSSEKLQASLATVTGSTEAASKAWAELLSFASETPFSLEQSVQGFIRMKSLGLDPTQEALRSFGNTASAMGKDMMQMVEAVADATTGEFERLKEFGIRASKEGEQITFTFQGVETTVRNSSQAINGYLQSIGENQFAGAMADQMDTLGGKMSNLQDSVYQLFLAIGESGAADAFSNTLDYAIGVTESLTENIDRVVNAVAIMAAMFAGRAVQAIGALIAAKAGLVASTITLTGALTGLRTVMMTLFGPVGIIAGAAMLIFQFREELGLIQAPAITAADAVDELATRVDGASKSMLKFESAAFTAELVSLQAAAQQAEENIANLNREQERMGGTGPGPGGQVGAVVIERHERNLESINNRIKAREDAIETLNGKMEELNRTETRSIQTRDIGSQSTGKATRETDKFAQSLQALEDRLYPAEAAQREMRQSQMLLQTALLNGTINIERYFDAIQRLEDSTRNASSAAEVYGLHIDSTTEAANDASGAARDLGFAFESAFESAILEGESFRDVLDGIFNDIIRIALRTGVTQPLGEAIGGLFQGGGVEGGFMSQVSFGGNRRNGGPVSSGSIYEVNEGGAPEMLQQNGRQYLLPGANGNVVPFAPSGGGNGGGVEVNVYAPEGSSVQTQERQNSNGGKSIDVMIDEATAQNINTPGSRTSRAMQHKFGTQNVLTGR